MAEPWLNFMDAYRGPHGGFGKRSWDDAIKNYSAKQIKVALQQQGLRGSSIGSGLRTVGYMKGVAGMGDPSTGYVNPGNPLGRFQGPHGNLGMKAYTAARDSGMYKLDDLPNLAAQSGMFLPEGAQNEWEMNMADKYKEEKFEDPHYTADASGVGTSAMGVKSKKDPNAGKTGSTSDLKRKNMLINKSLNV